MCVLVHMHTEQSRRDGHIMKRNVLLIERYTDLGKNFTIVSSNQKLHPPFIIKENGHDNNDL